MKEESESELGVLIKHPETSEREVFPVSSTYPLTVGRAPDNIVRLADPRVTRHHCMVCAEDGHVYLLTDAYSNTRVNGAKVQRKHELAPGDVIVLGTTVFRFEQSDAES